MASSKFNRATAVVALAFATGSLPAIAGANDFFSGGQMFVPGQVGDLNQDDTPSGPPTKSKSRDDSGSSSSSTQAAPGGSINGGGANSLGGGSNSLGSNNSPPPGAPPAGQEFTGDEKRMRAKYKINMAYFKQEIAKGEKMMEKAPNQNDPMYKKGKIFKEIGEKHLAELQASNPYQIDNLDGGDKKDGDTTGNTASGSPGTGADSGKKTFFSSFTGLFHRGGAPNANGADKATSTASAAGASSTSSASTSSASDTSSTASGATPSSAASTTSTDTSATTSASDSSSTGAVPADTTGGSSLTGAESTGSLDAADTTPGSLSGTTAGGDSLGSATDAGSATK